MVNEVTFVTFSTNSEDIPVSTFYSFPVQSVRVDPWCLIHTIRARVPFWMSNAVAYRFVRIMLESALIPMATISIVIPTKTTVLLSAVFSRFLNFVRVQTQFTDPFESQLEFLPFFLQFFAIFKFMDCTMTELTNLACAF